MKRSVGLASLFLAALVACWGQSFTSTDGPISFTGTGGSSASPYGSTVTVSGISAPVQTVTVTITNFQGTNGSNGAFVGDLAWELVDNQSHAFVFWADYPLDGNSIGQTSPVSFTFSDSGNTVGNNFIFPTTPPSPYKPVTGGVLTFNSPAPNDGSSSYATSAGSATFTGVFNQNTSPNGTWTLYTLDHGADTSFPGKFASWTLTITPETLTSTTTTVSPSLASPILTTQSPTFTATVTSSGGPVSTGTVAFTDDGTTIAGCGAAAVSVGTATCTTSLPEGTHTIKAAYSGGGAFGPSSGSLTDYIVYHPTTTTGTAGQFCNTGGFTLNYTQNATGAPYPSYINVTGQTGSVASVSLQLNNGTTGASGPDGVSLLLVDPSGHEFIPVQNTGGTNPVSSGVTFNLADSGTTAIPTPWVSGTYSPTSNPTMATWPAPAPAVTTANAAAPEGGASFTSSFLGDTADGFWALYPIIGRDFDAGNTGSFSGGWCVTLTTSGDPASTTTVTSSQNPTLESTDVTITATVQDANTHSAVTAGTVTFKEGTTVLASAVSLNGSGQASFTYSSAVEGDHFITAYYSGATGNHAPSTSSPFDERVNHPTTNPSSGVYCNTGAISLPNTGGAPYDSQPYPSDITLPFIPGQVTSFTVTANGVTVYPEYLGLLLTSPNGSPVQNLVLMANEGGATTLTSGIALTFSDAGASFPASLTASGTYKPGASSTSNISFPSPAPPAADLVYPPTVGSGTLATSFSDAFPTSFTGVWSLFANTWEANPGQSISGGWCLNLTVTPPAASVTKTAVSGPWTQGQQNVSYTIAVKNNGPGSSGGTASPVTVSDTLPSSLAPASTPGSGTDWSCAAVSQTITCTNPDIVASGSSYPALTLFANVSPTAPSPVSNTATVTGGGFSLVNSNTTSTTVNPAPVLSVGKSAVGTFTQGSTAEWDVTVSNTAAGSATFGTTTAVDTLPSNYTLSSYSGSGWTCSGVAQIITCTSSTAVSGGSAFPTLKIIVNVPAASPVSVTNNVVAFGGGDLTHTSSSNGATASSTAAVVQVPATITINAGATQSATVGTAFATALAVTVKDANSVPIVGTSVTFTVVPGGSGQSGTFAGNVTTVTTPTNSSGVASAGTFTANSIAGSYTVSVTDSPAPAATFNLTNTIAAPTVTNITSTVANGSYGVGAVIPITVTFSHAVNVTGVPSIAPNSGGSASYSAGSGTSTLTFTYTVASPQSTSHLDASSTTALTLNGGTITDSSSNNAVLTLPVGATAGSLYSNKTIVIDTTAPAVVSYNALFGSAGSYNVSANTGGRTRLPWEITGIQVVFSKPIVSGDVNSLSGITTTAFSGLGTTTLTWSITPAPIGSFSTVLEGTGVDAIKDAAGNALAGGSGFSQAFKVLWGDFNDDGVVNSQDLVLVNKAISAAYNIFADINGDGVVNALDVQAVRLRLGTTQP
jgi:hypothetical protein